MKKCPKCGTELIQESIETYHHNQNGEPLYLDVLLCPICDYGGKKMKIKVMSIQNLLRIPHLKSSFEHAIIFITTNPNYYDFGYTRFLHLNIADTDAPVISDYNFQILSYFAKIDSINFETVYVCCDAGLSRSPAVALYIAMKLQDLKMVSYIKAKYRFLNESLYNELMNR